MHEETKRRIALPAQQAYIREIHRVQRLYAGLHGAIKTHDDKRIRHWQILICLHYGIEFFEWKDCRPKGMHAQMRLEWKQIERGTR